MPRRSILSAAERASLLSPPDTEDELIRHYAFSETDLSLIRQRRGDANRLGFAVQLCLLHFPGQGLLPDASMPMSLLQWIGRQLRIDPSCWPQYARKRWSTRSFTEKKGGAA
jgi:TnpA family transposase